MKASEKNLILSQGYKRIIDRRIHFDVDFNNGC